MSLVVCDASVIFKLIVAEENSSQALTLAQQYQIAVPEFLFLEIGNGLWTRVRRGTSRAVDVPRLLDEIDTFGFEVHPLKPLVRPALSLATSLQHPIYDCAYLALAEAHAVPLVTADRRFLNALMRANRQTVEIMWLAAFA